MSIMEIASRIAEIQNRFGAPVGVGISPAGTSFADSLDQVNSGGAGGSLDGPTDGTTGVDAVLSAEKYLGVPYKYGGINPESGLDCSGFVQRAYADLGVQLPRVAKDQATQGIAIPNLSQAEPGDLFAFGKPVSHIGIYVGDGKMIVAPHTGDKVKIEDVGTTPTTIRRLLPTATPAYDATGGGAVIRPAALSASVPYAAMFRDSAAKYGIPASVLAAVAKVESGYNPSAVSPSGAEGLMQLMPGTASGLGVNPLDPQQSIDGAARLLSQNLKSFGSLDLALAAYNAGGGAVRKYNGIPPYPETQAYVPKVRAAMTDLSGKGFA
jgi:hypothetical protein